MRILASIEAGTAKPAIILNHLLAQPHNPAAQGLVELGKLEQSSYALQYGMNKVFCLKVKSASQVVLNNMFIAFYLLFL